MAETIKTVGVIGAGQMGSGIAQVFAQQGEFTVLIQDSLPQQLDKSKVGISASLEKFAAKGTITAQQQTESMNRLSFISDIGDLAEADLVIEAVTEDEPLKQSIFATLGTVVKPHTILASNTSSIPITRLAAATDRPGKVIGMHFMNPVPLMKLVEIIRGAQTTDDTYDAIHTTTLALEKTPVLSHDYPGFIANRILMPMLNEAMFAVFEGVGSAEDIDTVMKLGMNHPMGPLQLADFIGLDTCLSILKVLYDGFKDPKYRPCPLLVQKVNAGYLGKKSGRGFFEYGR